MVIRRIERGKVIAVREMMSRHVVCVLIDGTWKFSIV